MPRLYIEGEWVYDEYESNALTNAPNSFTHLHTEDKFFNISVREKIHRRTLHTVDIQRRI